MRKYWIVLTLCLLSVWTMSGTVFSASNDVVVELPNLKVIVNGVELQNNYRNYPVVMYNKIPYYPLTYNDARHLGIEVKKDVKGLFVTKTGVSAGLRTDLCDTKNPQKDLAARATYSIYINGKGVTRNEVNAPFLIYRNVPYMPMKQSQVTTNLGIKCTLSNSEGIQIESSNLKTENIAIKEYLSGDLAVAYGNLYFFDGHHNVVQVASDEPSLVKNIYEGPPVDEHVKETGQLLNDEGRVLLTSKWDRELFYQVNSDGTMEKAQIYLGDIAIHLDYGDYYGHHNFTIKRRGEDFKPAGQPNFVYGMSFEHHDMPDNRWARSGGVPDYYRIGQDLYILAADLLLKEEYSRIYKVNLDTNMITRVSDEHVNTFKMEDSTIYTFTDKGIHTQNILTHAIKDYKVTGKVRKLLVLAGRVYYMNAQDGELYVLEGDACRPINAGSKVIDFKLKNGYLACTFEEKPKNPYRMMIIDKAGHVAFKTSDTVDMATVSIDFGVLYYAESKSHLIYRALLK